MRREKKTRPSPVSLSIFSFVPDLLFDCSRVLEYAKIRTVLQSKLLVVIGMTMKLTLCHNLQARQVEKTSCDLDEAKGRTCPDLS